MFSNNPFIVIFIQLNSQNYFPHFTVLIPWILMCLFTRVLLAVVLFSRVAQQLDGSESLIWHVFLARSPSQVSDYFKWQFFKFGNLSQTISLANLGGGSKALTATRFQPSPSALLCHDVTLSQSRHNTR